MTDDKLRRLRPLLGLNQRELAARVEAHQNSIARQFFGDLGIREPLARLIRLLPDQAPRRRYGREA